MAIRLCRGLTGRHNNSVMVFTGATLGLFFSYYRHPPLLISIKWLTLTLILNSFLLAILWNERVEAEELGNDPEKVTFFFFWISYATAVQQNTGAARELGYCCTYDMFVFRSHVFPCF